MRVVRLISMMLAGAATTLPMAAMARPADEISLNAMPLAKPIDVRLSSDLRLRTDVTTTARIDPFGDPEGRMRHRFASSMIDYYPLGGASGLRLSAGVRFFAVNNFLKDAEKATGGLLWAPRLPGSGSGVRTGFARHTPAATVGYTGTIKNAVFGFEVGSLIGNVNAQLPREYSLGHSARGGLNPVANLVLGFKF